MAEWSKATHLSCVLFGGEGSNPSGVILKVLTATYCIANGWHSDFQSDFRGFNSHIQFVYLDSLLALVAQLVKAPCL